LNGGHGALARPRPETAARALDLNLPGVPLHGAFSYKKKKGAKVAPRTVPEFEGGFDAIVGNPPERQKRPNPGAPGNTSRKRCRL
jgi:hypothetical protein